MSSRYARQAALRTLGADRNAGFLHDLLVTQGCSVSLNHGGDGRPDWTIGGWGVTVHVEVKPAAEPGKVKPSQSRLRERQQKWHDGWRGARPWVLRTPEDVERLTRWLRRAAEALRAANIQGGASPPPPELTSGPRSTT